MSGASRRVLIAASGSGGHLFPALFIARAILKLAPDTQITFVGSGRPLEEKIIGGAGFRIDTIPIVGLRKRGIKGALQFLTMLPKAVGVTWRLLTELKPDLVVGVGGYASVLPVLLGSVKRIPTWIHEAEKEPGLANKLLGYFASGVSVTFNDTPMPHPSRVIVTGHPVREDLAQGIPTVPEGEKLNRILVLGGSQGAESLDVAMAKLAPRLKEIEVEVFHQCREQNEAKLKDAYEAASLSYTLRPFIDDLSSAYRWSHLVIARAGAGTVMELSIVNRPAILVPLPSKGIQQHSNAKVLEAAGKAILLEEGSSFEESSFEDRLYTCIVKMLTPEDFFQMQSKPLPQRKLGAADSIARGCLELRTFSRRTD